MARPGGSAARGEAIVIGGWISDVTSAWRSLWRAPLWAALAIMAMALGIAANASTSAVAYGVLVRPLPYAEPDRLVLISAVDTASGDDEDLGYAEVRAWIERLQTTESAAAYASEELTVRGAGEPITVRAALVTGPFLRVLGAPASAGRMDADAESAVVDVDLARRFGEPAAAIGRAVAAGPRALTIAGVMCDSCAFPAERTGLWMSAEGMPGISLFGSSDSRHFHIVARLAPGVTLSQARADADRVAHETDAPFHHPPGRRRGTVTPLTETLVAPARPALRIFFAAGLFVLLIACANVATIVAARAAGRHREFAVRVALGAGRWRLLRALAAEAGLIAAAGAGGGLALAYVAVRAFAAAPAMSLPRRGAMAVDAHVVAWSIALAATATFVCALLPAAGVWRDRLGLLRAAQSTASASARRVRDALIVLQLALAVVLLVGAALLGRTVLALSRTDIGIDPGGTVAVTLMLGERMHFDAGARAPFIREALRRLRALPTVRAAGFGASLPPRSSLVRMSFSTERNQEPLLCELVPVSAGYLEAIGARLTRGRTFTDADLDGHAAVMVVSETIVRRKFPDRDPLGQTLFPLPRSKVFPAIVGVVEDVKYSGIDAPARAAVYVPWPSLPSSILNLVVKATGEPRALAMSVRRVLRDLDPALPVGEIRPMTDVIANAFADRRLRAAVAGGFALLAILLALAGLVGSLGRLVIERRRELAIRTALGSSPERTIRLVLAHGATLIAIGIVVGVAAATAATRALAHMLYGVGPYDVRTFVVVAAAVAALSLLASYVPARRATRIDPLALLRAE
jgi:putative ABC transport system permease protein